MRQAVADQATTDQQNRAAVVGMLQQAQVRDLAGRLGLNLTTAENAVSTLSSTELAKAATEARAINTDIATQLAGGSNTVIISTTTLLLIIIIVILLVS